MQRYGKAREELAAVSAQKRRQQLAATLRLEADLRARRRLFRDFYRRLCPFVAFHDEVRDCFVQMGASLHCGRIWAAGIAITLAANALLCVSVAMLALTLVYTVGPTLVAVAKATVHWMVVALVVYLIICHVILVAARVCCTLLQGLWHWFSYWGQRQRLLQATTTCPVCLDDFGSGSQDEGEVAPGNGVDVPLCSLVCGHVFHDGCVRPWVALHNTCPCCRLHVTR